MRCSVNDSWMEVGSLFFFNWVFFFGVIY
jgi:hypothetical protein